MSNEAAIRAAAENIAEMYRSTNKSLGYEHYEPSIEAIEILISDPGVDSATAERERDILAEAIATLATKAGIIDGTMPLTGPHLLMLCDDIAKTFEVDSATEQGDEEWIAGYRGYCPNCAEEFRDFDKHQAHQCPLKPATDRAELMREEEPVKVDRRTRAGGKPRLNTKRLGKMSIAERFWSNVDKSGGYGPSGDCWRWTGFVTEHNYGRIRIHRREYAAHRLSFQLAHGREPQTGLVVMHSCDTPNCVNPSHLSEGTVQDNNRDCKEKRRLRYGVQHQNTKLDDESVQRIRQLAKSGKTQREIARQFDVSQTAIAQLLRGRTWAQLPPSKQSS